ncbi:MULTISPECIES: SH3 domain-containing protein [unclassified Streptococcus]|uniref:SH3 domain-containing protein n=1 Tax=unclassified Streptococcus TaxID=2608887 RepID=UPI0019120552|nr:MULTISPECIES: SH3 domain-containing protein [unclassified Streptococcus]MBK5046715.1 SH3 domain-containing protein [Streptococcus sp. 2.1]MBK5161706.1 SH3 domain-containing protein [Streptococcus sp. 3.1]
MRKAYVFKERQRYSIRKYSFGAASVLIGASLMLGGHALAQEQANSTGSITDYEVTVNNSEAPQIDQATSEAVTEVLNEPASRSEAPRPKLASSEVASSEASSVVVSEAASLEVPAEVAQSASAVASVASSEVASPRYEVSSVASSEVVSEINRSATSEVAEARVTDREAVDTSLRTVLTNASQPGVDGPVTADGSLDIPSNGTYYFRRTTEIRTAPVMDIKPTFVFSAGDHVIYDKVLKRDNHQWISYIGYDYERYYADIAALKAENTSSNTEATRDETIPERGTYYFTKPADVKNQPSLTAKTEFNFDPGMSVNYDRSLLADNHRWISYTSYSGTRRYVDLGAVAEAVAKPRGDISIESHNNGDFSVVISNVSDQNGVLGVSVPIWSEKNGQDDIIWYNATRLNNGNYKVNVSLTDHKNERGLYNVHLYYVETNGKLVGVGGTTYTVPAKVEETHTTTSYSLPDSGTYTFKERTGIKAEPRVASPELAYYDAGMSVNYDKIVSGDGYEWLSYLSYNGNRRYVAVAKLAQQESKPSGTINIENLSNLGFDVHITNVSGGDKAIQSVSVPVWTAKDGQDDLVWHQANRQSDGSYKVRINVSDHKAEAGEYIVHLYYVQDGKMVGIGGTSTTVPVQNATRHNLPASGSYTFTARTGIKAEPRVASPELAYYDAGMSVNYDKIVSGDGYQWLSYLSYNGNRRYVAVSKLAQQESKPSGTINIENLSNLGFDVHITNVSGGDKAIQSVSVPVWTAKDGQDDLVWHQANRQSDGSYKVRINVSDHKAEAGEYIVHLYYVQDGKMVGIGGTSTTVPVQNATRHNLTASGSYTFTARSGIKTQPLVANPDVSYYDAGMSVNYDKVVNNDGYTWLSYLSYSGHRFYVAIAPTSVTKPVEQPVQPSTPSSGTYTFKERSSIKAEPSVASPELAYYDAGMSVNYDRLVTADGRTWLSYVSHGGNRRYIAIDGKATAVAQPKSPSLAATGTYTFTKPSSIKAQPSVASPELAYYDKGMSVRYDKVLTADGHTWLSYVTYSGARRYVDIA